MMEMPERRFTSHGFRTTHLLRSKALDPKCVDTPLFGLSAEMLLAYVDIRFWMHFTTLHHFIINNVQG